MLYYLKTSSYISLTTVIVMNIKWYQVNTEEHITTHTNYVSLYQLYAPVF